MRSIEIRSIPHHEHRYETVGDYFDDECGTHIIVSEMGNEDYEFLVCLHELIEQYLCRKRGIKEEDIVIFDKMFEKEREDGKWDKEEPGDDPRAPYRREHFVSTNIERMVAHEMGVDWSKYSDVVDAL